MVPRQLTSTHMEQGMVVSIEHIKLYHEDGNDFLFRIVTGMKRWVHHFTPESKAASMGGNIRHHLSERSSDNSLCR
ncbi:uncharacterized protein TNIN_198211 [Trichonephila inaurata madagascariensis]|uniref:Uncharacterized protein n=1 Tax=Trichonephila inaurata madagascariensis TaxID=2747483 RepID=A0A8X6J8K0_9ARAC|nr:uncharacterized protein TNIN_198211 [Trichonephila inaurata madagascariensis]